MNINWQKKTIRTASPSGNSDCTGSESTRKAFELASVVMKSDAGIENLRAFIAMKPANAAWRGFPAVPPGSILETVLTAFKDCTDIPLEIPFVTTLSFMSGLLLEEKVRINLVGSLIAPTMMSVVLGESGSGKSFTHRTLTQTLRKPVSEFPEAASAARFVELLHSNNDSLWIRDEFGQFLKALQEQTHMAEMKDYILRAYDGAKIERQTKQERIAVHEPALSILGFTVFETFRSQVPPDSLIDGFGQRFQYTIARKDPERRLRDYPLYDLSEHFTRIGDAWDRLNAIPLHPVYTVTPAAVEAYKSAFTTIRGVNEELPESFFRRSMFAAVRYALIYHFMLGKETAEIDEADIAWAARLVSLHMDDTRAILVDHGLSDLERLVQRAEHVCEEARSRGETVTTRMLIRRINAVKNVQQAAQLLALVRG